MASENQALEKFFSAHLEGFGEYPQSRWVRAPGLPLRLACCKLYNAASTPHLLGASTPTGETMTKQYSRMLLAVATAFWISAAIADEHGHPHPHFAPDVDAFHSLLAPVWHARPGKARSREACAKAGEMARLASQIRSADATALVASIGRLQSTCKTKPAGIDAAFFDVHEAFHQLIDAQPPVSAR